MKMNTRRNFFGKIGAMAALVTGAPQLFLAVPAAGSPTWNRVHGRTWRRYASSLGQR